MGLLFRLYFNALFNGNPFVVAITMIVGLALSVGVFYDGISSGDPVARGLAALVAAGFVLVLTVAIIDRRNNSRRRKGRRPAGSDRR